MAKDKVVLAYSGGLDTSVCIKWLQEEKGLDVIAVVGEVGQEHEGLEKVKEKALKTGALECYVIDMRELFVNEYLTKALAAMRTSKASTRWSLRFRVHSSPSSWLMSRIKKVRSTSLMVALARATIRSVSRLPFRRSTPASRSWPPCANGIFIRVLKRSITLKLTACP